MKEADPIVRRFLERSRAISDKLVAVYLFGSRARGTARPDSDYDVALVVTDSFSLADKDVLYDAVMDILLETGRLVSLKVFNVAEFQRLRALRTPFTQHLVTEGFQVG